MTSESEESNHREYMYDRFNPITLINQVRRGVIAIDGPSGSGKTTMAKALAKAYRRRHLRVAVIHTDWFATWDNPVGWWPEMVQEVLAPLWRGEAVWFTPLQWRNGVTEPGPRQYLDRASVVIIEGVSSARKSIAPILNKALWVDGGGEQECLERAVRRDGENERRHLELWQDFERGWFAVDQTKSRCTIVPHNQRKET